MSAGHRTRQAALATATALLVVASALYAGVRWRWFRGPYSGLGVHFAWLVGEPEAAYNFDVVVGGSIYRSGAPDARFLHYLREIYDIDSIIALNGEKTAAAARDLGMDVKSFAWSASRPPPEDELASVIAAMDSGTPVLVHCASGSDRTGFAVATYRLRRQGWSRERALAELARTSKQPLLRQALAKDPG